MLSEAKAETGGGCLDASVRSEKSRSLPWSASR